MRRRLNNRKILLLNKIMIYLKKKLRLILVPAAAVKRGELVLFGITGRKGYVDCMVILKKKLKSLTFVIF